MKEIYRLFNIQKIDDYNKYTNMFKAENIACIEDILPRHEIESYKKNLQLCNSLILEKDNKNYREKAEKYNFLFNKLLPCKINGLYYRTILNLEKNETIVNNIKTFKPSKGYCKKVNYNMFKTMTGRLVNSNLSPRILTLPSRCRKIFESEWGKGGKIVSIDFKTLEPRLARKLNNKESSEDIYTELSDLLEYNVDRSIIKRAVISILYGSEAPLQELSLERSKAVLNAVKEYFDLEKLLKIADNSTEHGWRENYFGRPLHNLNETNNNKIVNNYIQSSAVDIALTYFCKLVENINIELCRPLFIIHDAIVFDVNLDYLTELELLTEKGYECSQLGYFPVELTNLIKEK